MSNATARFTLDNGTGIIFSDAHFWPNIVTTAHRALCRLCDDLRPKLVVANGDILDGARISKYARIGWQHAPKLSEELEACKQRMAEIEHAAAAAHKVWTLGNHDARFETFLANRSPEFEGIPGFTLKEHFPAWEPCWELQLNHGTIIRHRWHGGANATLNNTIKSGVSIFTGHLHAQRISPYTDYTGTRFGVDCGTLADPEGPQFTAYLEGRRVDWRSGFIVATWADGKLLWPEEVHVIAPGQVSFRGKIISV